MKRVWNWVVWVIGGLLAAVAVLFALRSRDDEKKSVSARNKEEKARVKLADLEAERKVDEARKRGSFADRMRDDGAGS